MDYKETIWVTGCKGFLGREIVKRLKATYNCTVVGTDKELMVTDPERIDAFAQDLRPDVVINCAGISRAVTGLSNRIHAYEVNALGARNVALAANNVGVWYRSQRTTCSPYAWQNPPTNSTHPTPKRLTANRSAQAR